MSGYGRFMQKLAGIAVSPGVAIGEALVIDNEGFRIPRRFVARDAVAWTDSTDPNRIKLEFLRGPDGKWMPLTVPGISLGPFEVPVNGVSIDGKMFVVFATGFRPPVIAGRSVLAVSEDNAKTFRQVYQLSDNKFRVVAMWKSDPWLYVFGSGEYRNSSVCLARVELDRIRDRSAIRYFRGTDAEGRPQSPHKKSRPFSTLASPS